MNATSPTSHAHVHMKGSRHKKRSGWTPLGVAAMVFGFIIAWPVGLAVLAYILWGGRVDDLVSRAVEAIKGTTRRTAASSGNKAFDEYKASTLRDLEQQQAEFAEYVDQLRQARDREEFEHFMNSKKNKNDTKK